MSHSADFAIAPLIAVLADFSINLVPQDVIARLEVFEGEHSFTSSTFSPPFDVYPRNITAWLSEGVTIGAESFNETVVGGPATSSDSFRPAVVQWDTGDGVGWIAVCFSLSPSLYISGIVCLANSADKVNTVASN